MISPAAAHNGVDPFSTALVPSISIENLVAERNGRIQYVTEAHRLLNLASLDLMFAHGKHYRGSFRVDQATKEIDAGYWSKLLGESGLSSFLDAEARAKWREAIDKLDVPELTEANIKATFSALYAARGDMFERGVVELFRKLSWRYKTNQPVKFGKRIILSYCVERWHKGETFGVAHAASDKLDDLLRVMSVLDGKPEPDHRNASFRTLNDVHWMRSPHGPSEATVPAPAPDGSTDRCYFSLRGFKNGNAHLTFLRLDLVDAMNRILHKHHPDALPPGADDWK